MCCIAEMSSSSLKMQKQSQDLKLVFNIIMLHHAVSFVFLLKELALIIQNAWFHIDIFIILFHTGFLKWLTGRIFVT